MTRHAYAAQVGRVSCDVRAGWAATASPNPVPRTLVNRRRHRHHRGPPWLACLRTPIPGIGQLFLASLLGALAGLSLAICPPPPCPPFLPFRVLAICQNCLLTATMATIDMRGADSAGGSSSGKSHYDPVAAPVPIAAGAASGMDDDFSYGTSVGTSDKYVRLQFLRKVYTILSLQLAMTVGVSGLFMLANPVRRFVLAAQGPMTIVGMIATFGFLFGLMATKDQHPMNLYMLAGFTAAESYMVGTICAVYAERGIGDLVLEAFGLTMLVFVSLTVYCFVSKRDFSFLGGFLFAGLLIILGASVLNLLFGLGGAQNSTFGFAISVGGALLFTGYILYDTSVIMNQLGPDEWALAAVNLYVRGWWCGAGFVGRGWGWGMGVVWTFNGGSCFFLAFAVPCRCLLSALLAGPCVPLLTLPLASCCCTLVCPCVHKRTRLACALVNICYFFIAV